MKTKVTALSEFRYGKPEGGKRAKAKNVVPAGTVFEYEGDEKSLAKLVTRRAVRMPTEAELALDAMRTGGGSRARTARAAAPPPPPPRVVGRGGKPKDEAPTADADEAGTKKPDLIG